eukprot:2539890-Prymnesium_polylepis.1
MLDAAQAGGGVAPLPGSNRALFCCLAAALIDLAAVCTEMDAWALHLAVRSTRTSSRASATACCPRRRRATLASWPRRWCAASTCAAGSRLAARPRWRS